MKQTKIALTTCLLFVAHSLLSQVTKEYSFTDFDKIEASSTFAIEIEQSAEFSVVVTCDETILEKLDVELEGGKLSLELDHWKGSIKSRPQALIKMPDIKEIEISGASSVVLKKMDLNNLEVELSSASTIEGDLEVKSIALDVSGASSVGLSGRCEKAHVYLSGASQFRGKGFYISDEAILDFSGASVASCQIDGDMFVNLSGASTLSYSGEGTILKEEVSGASSVHKQ